jgi:hypothetical protein
VTEQESTTSDNPIKKVELTPELIEELKRRFPQEFVGTPEWEHKVRIEAIIGTFYEEE